MGIFSNAAMYHQYVAEIYEFQLADLDRAVQHYEKAADYFRGNLKRLVRVDAINLISCIIQQRK